MYDSCYVFDFYVILMWFWVCNEVLILLCVVYCKYYMCIFVLKLVYINWVIMNWWDGINGGDGIGNFGLIFYYKKKRFWRCLFGKVKKSWCDWNWKWCYC